MSGRRDQELTFTGPATFFKAPLLASGAGRSDEPTAPSAPLGPPGSLTPRHDCAVLGVPYDFAVGFRPGARFAAAAVRAASGRFALPPDGFYDLARDHRRLRGLDLVDAGDVDVLQLDTEATFERITRAAGRLRELVRLPLFVGGDHSISFPLLRAYQGAGPLHVVQLDAHLDYSDARNGTELSNSSPFRRAFETVANLSGRTVIGLRGIRADEEAVAASRAAAHRLFLADEVHDDLPAVLDGLPQGERVYLSLDVDVLDPATLPGTSSPEPDGLSFRQLRRLLERLIEGNELVGFDLTELAPNLDPSGRSELLAARLVAEVLAFWWDRESAAAAG